MKTYLDLLEKVRKEGVLKDDRTGTGTLSLFGERMEFDLQKGFPLVTTKKIHVKSVLHELLWFIRGSGNVAYLKRNGVKIWDEWADEFGDLGPVYGVQWRSWSHPDGTVVDQLSQAIHTLQTNPDSRRIIVSTWNVGELGKMALAPCHLLFQFYSSEKTHRDYLEEYVKAEQPGTLGTILLLGEGTAEERKRAAEWVHDTKPLTRKLSCQMYQRSADMFLGVPFNIASYAFLTHMVAKLCNMTPDRFIHVLGDAHIYLNHLNQVDEQLSRKPLCLPTLEIQGAQESIDDFRYEDFVVHNYDPYPSIKAPVAV